MAVEDKYVDSNVAGGKKANAYEFHGAPLNCAVASEELAAADDDGSVYRFFRLPANAVIVKLDVINDAITSGTDFDIGFYEPGAGGAEKDKDVLTDGDDLSSAGSQDGLQTVDAANRGKMVFEHAGDSESAKFAEYDLALTGNTVGSAAGTITMICYWVEG